MDASSWVAQRETCTTVLFYTYFPVPLSAAAADALRLEMEALCASLGSLKGRVLNSLDGVNGTLGGVGADVAAFQSGIETLLPPPLLTAIDWKTSRFPMPASGAPFPDMRVKRVGEIVSSSGRLSTVGVGSRESGGTHISPEEFHATLAGAKEGDDLVVLDVRNRFEVAVGHFVDGAGRAAVQPEMRTFEQFADFVDRASTGDDALLTGKRVVMYCTGGIRCETASAYLKANSGAKSVAQLDGGIHRYLDAFPDADGTREGGFFAGKNFVFDQRIAVGSDGTAAPSMEEAAVARAAGATPAVGCCVECGDAWDTLSPGAVCTVCVCLTLVCPRCRAEGAARVGPRALRAAAAGGGGATSAAAAPPPPAEPAPNTGLPRRYEWFCDAHRYLRESFVHFVDEHELSALAEQRVALEALVALADAALASGSAPPLHARAEADMACRDRRTLERQVRRLHSRIAALRKGRKGTVVRAADAARRCRHCKREGCGGKCWGFWKAPAPPQSKKSAAPSSPAMP